MRINYTKRQAVALFGSPGKMAQALNSSPQAIYMLPAKLARKKQDEIVGAAIRLGLVKVRQGETR